MVGMTPLRRRVLYLSPAIAVYLVAFASRFTLRPIVFALLVVVGGLLLVVGDRLAKRHTQPTAEPRPTNAP
jgi:hypothetical protein